MQMWTYSWIFVMRACVSTMVQCTAQPDLEITFGFQNATITLREIGLVQRKPIVPIAFIHSSVVASWSPTGRPGTEEQRKPRAQGSRFFLHPLNNGSAPAHSFHPSPISVHHCSGKTRLGLKALSGPAIRRRREWGGTSRAAELC